MAKTKNKKNSGLADKVNQKRKAEGVKKKLNPFEVHINREKIKVLGKKSKHDKGLPGVSRAKAMQKRKETLGTEMKLMNKTNAFIDRRIGEKNTQLSAEDRMIARFAAERAKQHNKKNIYNLADDEILTHRGQTLEQIEKFDDPRSDDEDDDGKGFGGLNDDFVSEGHFGGGVLAKTDSKDGAKSHKDLIEQLIAESKKRKAEKQKEKEQTLDLTEKLDSEWKDLQPVVFKKSRVENESIIDKVLSQAEKKSADYDKMMRELKFEKRGVPSDSLKSDEKAAKEEREKLEQWERERRERMEAEEMAVKAKPTAGKHRSAEDLDDNFELEDEKQFMLAYDKDGKPLVPEHILKDFSVPNSKPKFDDGISDTSSEDGDDDDDDEESNENSEESGESDENDELNGTKIKEKGEKISKESKSDNSETEESANESAESDEEEISETKISNTKSKEISTSKEESDKTNAINLKQYDNLNEATPITNGQAKDTEEGGLFQNSKSDDESSENDDENDESSESGEDEEVSETETKEKANKKDDFNDLRETDDEESEVEMADEENIEYFFDQKTLEGDNLQELLSNKTPAQQSVALQKLIKSYDPSLSENNKEFLSRLFAHMLQYTNDIFTNIKNEGDILKAFLTFDRLVPHFFDLAKLNKVSTKKYLVQLLKEKRDKYKRNTKRVPNLDTLIFFKLVSLLYPTSDFAHPVTTPCLIFMSDILHLARFNDAYSIARGLFITSLILEFTVLSKRLVPSAINFLRGVLFLSANTSILNPIQVVPPFKLHTDSKLLKLERDCSKMTVENKMAVKDLAANEINDDFRIRSFYSCVLMTKEFFDNFNDLEAQECLFESHIKLLGRVELDYYPKKVRTMVSGIVKDMKDSLEVKTYTPLCGEKKRIKTLRLYEPDVQEVFTGSKSSKLSREQAERSRLQNKYKKEMKGALREIRRDKAYIASVKIRQKIHSDNIRKEKVKQIYKDASIQQGELNKLKRGK